MSPRGATDVIDPELATVEHTRRRCARHTPNPIMQSTERNCADTIGTVPILWAVHLYTLHSHKLQLQKQEITKKNKGKRKTHNVSKSTTCQMHTTYARRKGGAENASTGKCKYETAHFARMENACTENASTMQTFSQIKKVWYFTS